MPWHGTTGWGFTKESKEGQDNILMMAALLQNDGWSKKAIAAFCGNTQNEGLLNPWQWENADYPTYAQYEIWRNEGSIQHGYGLVGWTPASAYIENEKNTPGYGPYFTDRASEAKATDGNAQMLRIIRELNTPGTVYWQGGRRSYYYSAFQSVGVDIDEFYPMELSTFKAGNDTLPNLVGAFELMFEKPRFDSAASSYSRRVSDCQWIYENVLSGTPDPPVGQKRLGWLIAKNNRFIIERRNQR